MKLKQIVYYDSFINDESDSISERFTSAVLDYLKEMIEEKGEIKEWTVRISKKEDTPQQSSNGNDCGVFVCMLADYLSDDLTFNFNSRDAFMLRQKICHSILKKKLPY